MKKEFTIGNALSIFIPTIFIILGWTNSINSQVNEHKIRIQKVEVRQDKIESKIDKIYDITTEILIKVESKQDR